MAVDSTNMGLHIWDQLTDNFDHTDLADNFTAIDTHDHTSGKGVPIPVGGLGVGSVGTSQLQTASVTTAKIADGAVNADKLGSSTIPGDKIVDASIATGKLMDGAVTSAKIQDATVASGDLASGAALGNLASASVTDAKLASPNNSVYKTVFQTPLIRADGLTSGATVYIPQTGTSASWGTGVATGGAQAGSTWNFVSGDYLVNPLTTKFRVKMQVFVGATSPSTVTFNGGVYPVTMSGGNVTPGTVTAGSTTTTTATPTLATNTISRYTGSDFSASAFANDPGTYTLGFVVGSITVPAGISIQMAIQVRNA